MLRLAACLAALAVLLAASPATAHMTQCQRSCVGKPYSPTCVAWNFEGPRSAVFENECFARCMLEEDPTAHITQHNVKLPQACAKEYKEYGYWLGDIAACFVCPPPTGPSDGQPEEGDSLSLGEEALDAGEGALAAAYLEPFTAGEEGEQPGDDEQEQAAAVEPRKLLIVEPVDGGKEQLEQAVEQEAGEEEQGQEQPSARRLARRLLA